MTVRRAELSDCIAIAGLLRDAHAAAALPFLFSAPHASALASQHISTPDMFALVYTDDKHVLGVLLATSQQHPFAAIRYASETVWWIAPDARGRVATDMLDAYEAWAAEQGCSFAGMAALASFPRAAVIYRRRGYHAAETHFLKPLAPAA